MVSTTTSNKFWSLVCIKLLETSSVGKCRPPVVAAALWGEDWQGRCHVYLHLSRVQAVLQEVFVSWGLCSWELKSLFLPCFPSRVSWITTWETPRSLFCVSCIISSASSGGCSDAMWHEALGLDDFFQKKRKKMKKSWRQSLALRSRPPHRDARWLDEGEFPTRTCRDSPKLDFI